MPESDASQPVGNRRVGAATSGPGGERNRLFVGSCRMGLPLGSTKTTFPFMRRSVAGISVEEAIRALEENLWDMWSAFGRGQDCLLVDSPEVLRFETPIPFIPYNSVMKTRLGDGADRKIADILRAYTERAVPLMWVVHPSAQPRDLARRLEAHGLVEAEVVPGMVTSLRDRPPSRRLPRVDVERLGVDAREAFFELVAWRYSLPAAAADTLLSIMRARDFGDPACPTQAWVVREGGHIVSKVILHMTGTVAGIYGVATLAEHRGRGLAEQLTVTALAHARALGATLAILHSTPRARPLYERLGFSTVADFRLYSTPGTLHL